MVRVDVHALSQLPHRRDVFRFIGRASDASPSFLPAHCGLPAACAFAETLAMQIRSFRWPNQVVLAHIAEAAGVAAIAGRGRTHREEPGRLAA